MKVGSLDSKTAVAAPAAAERKKDVGAAGGSANEHEPSAKVALSKSSGMSAAAGDESFDSEKVDRIAGAIRDGRFTINAEAIADKLLINAQELMGTKHS